MITDEDYREELARELLSSGIEPNDLKLQLNQAELDMSTALAADLGIPFPPGLRPSPQAITPAPNLDQSLPKADVAIIT